MSPKSREPYYQYSYVRPAPVGPQPLEIGLSLLALPVVTVLAGLNEARVFAWVWGSGIMSGLGIGADAEPLAVRSPVEKWNGRQEPAYLQYLFGPVWRDVKHTTIVAVGKEKEAVKARFKRGQAGYFLPADDSVDDRRRNRIIS